MQETHPKGSTFTGSTLDVQIYLLHRFISPIPKLPSSQSNDSDMAVEEAKKVEVESQCPPEQPAAEKQEAKALVPVEEPLVSDEKPTDDSKALIIVEKRMNLNYEHCTLEG